jgi:hypothetical protein
MTALGIKRIEFVSVNGHGEKLLSGADFGRQRGQQYRQQIIAVLGQFRLRN